MRFDLRVLGPEELSREELIALAWGQAERLQAQDRQIAAQAGQIAELMEANEALASEAGAAGASAVAQLGQLLEPALARRRPGQAHTAAEAGRRAEGGPTRSRGKQPGASGSQLPWTDSPDQRRDRFPEGRCDCGEDPGLARDLGVGDRYQQHEIPQVSVTITQFDQHRVECGCGAWHTAGRPEGARAGAVG